jgi:hypothetical protein
MAVSSHLVCLLNMKVNYPETVLLPSAPPFDMNRHCLILTLKLGHHLSTAAIVIPLTPSRNMVLTCGPENPGSPAGVKTNSRNP